MTPDEIAESAFVRELRGIEGDIGRLERELREANARREKLLTGKSSFVAYVKHAVTDYKGY